MHMAMSAPPWKPARVAFERPTISLFGQLQKFNLAAARKALYPTARRRSAPSVFRRKATVFAYVLPMVGAAARPQRAADGSASWKETVAQVREQLVPARTHSMNAAASFDRCPRDAPLEGSRRFCSITTS